MVNNLYEKLIDKHVSVSELSRATKISRTTLTDLIKQRKHNLTFVKAKKIADFFGCSVTALFPELNENKETA